jgi:hypothetical protein
MIGYGEKLTLQIDCQHTTSRMEVSYIIQHDGITEPEQKFVYPCDQIQPVNPPAIANGQSFMFISPKLLIPGVITVRVLSDWGITPPPGLFQGVIEDPDPAVPLLEADVI